MRRSATRDRYTHRYLERPNDPRLAGSNHKFKRYCTQ